MCPQGFEPSEFRHEVIKTTNDNNKDQHKVEALY